MESDAGPAALVIGEALVDVVVRDGHRKAYPGGSSANTAVALARLDRRVGLATCLAADDYGRMLLDHLAAAGVSLVGDPETLGRTSSAVATIGADGAATYEFDLDWRPADAVPLPSTVVLHVGSLGAVLAPGAADVEAAVRRLRDGATTSYDVNARPAVTGTGPDVVEQVRRLASLADVVKASDEDLEALFPDLSLVEAAAMLRASGPAVVAVTRGGEGAYWVSAHGDGEIAPVVVDVADTIGAGDTFAAGLIDALWERDLLGPDRREALHALDADGWTEVLTWAARAAAVTVSRPGADPPYRREIQ